MKFWASIVRGTKSLGTVSALLLVLSALLGIFFGTKPPDAPGTVEVFAKKAVLTGHAGEVGSVAFSPDGAMLASGSQDSNDQEVILWVPRSGEVNQILLMGHKLPQDDHVYRIIPRHAPDLRLSVASKTRGAAFILQKASSDSETQTFRVRVVDDVWYRFEAVSAGKVIDNSNGHHIPCHLHDQRDSDGRDNILFALKAAPGGWFYVLAKSHGGHCWEIERTGEENGSLITSVQGPFHHQQFRFEQWDEVPRQQPLAGHRSSVRSIAFSPDGATIVLGGNDETVILLDAVSGTKKQTLVAHPTVSISFPDGKTLGRDDEVIQWEAGSGKQLTPARLQRNSVLSVAFSPDGATIASGHDKNVILWDSASGKKKHTLTGHAAAITCVAFSPDGARIAAGSDDNKVILWDVASGNKRNLTGHKDSVNCVAFGPDGATIASGSHDKTVILWDVASGNKKNLTGHNDSVYSVAFSPDGATVASGSHDHTVVLWDVASGRRKQTLNGHTSSVRSVAFSPGGATIASGSHDRTVILWDALVVSIAPCSQTEVVSVLTLSVLVEFVVIVMLVSRVRQKRQICNAGNRESSLGMDLSPTASNPPLRGSRLVSGGH